MGPLSAIKTMAGVLIYHFSHHHVVLQYPNVATVASLSPCSITPTLHQTVQGAENVVTADAGIS